MGIVRKENIMADKVDLDEFKDRFMYYAQILPEICNMESEEQTAGSLFFQNEKINRSTSPIFNYSEREEEIVSFSSGSCAEETTEDAVNLFTNYTVSRNYSTQLENCPEELLALFNNKIDLIEKAFENLKDKNLGEKQIVEKLNMVIQDILSKDNAFLEKIFNELKDSPDKLEKILNSKISMTAEKQELLENKIEEYCSKNSISPEITEKIINLVKNTNLTELENLKKMLNAENSSLSAEQKLRITSNLDTEKEEIDTGVKSMTKEEIEKKKEEIRQILNNLPQEVREQIVESISNAHLSLIEKLKAASKSENSFEARKLALIEYEEKMNEIFENITNNAILNNIAGKDSEETKKGIETVRKNLNDISRLSLRRKLAILKRNKDKELVCELELKNISKRHLSFMKGAEKAFDKRPSEVENVEAVFDMFAEVSNEHTKFVSEDIVSEAKLSKKSKEKLQEIAKKIKDNLKKIHKEAVENFWETSAGQKCIEYTRKIYEFRKANYEKRKREIEELKVKTVEAKEEAKKAKKVAFVKKEAAIKIKKQVMAKQHELKKKLGLSSGFKLTDVMLKNVDYQLAIKKKRADNEFIDARKQMLNAESDMRLANYFLVWAEKMASFEKNLCSIYENFFS